MILVQDQNKQGNRSKNFDSELQIKQDSSKQICSDPKHFWDVDCGWKTTNTPKDTWGLSCEEELLTSDNDTDEPEENLFEEGLDYPQGIHEGRQPINSSGWKKPFKNVRFESSDFNYALDTSETSSGENDQQDDFDCGYQEHGQGSYVKMTDHLRTSCKPKWRNSDCYNMNYERRPKSSPEKSNSYIDVGDERRPVSLDDYADVTEPRQRIRRIEHRCLNRTLHGDGDTDHFLLNRKSKYKFDYGEDVRGRRLNDCCDHRTIEETKKKSLLKPRSIHKHHLCPLNDSLHDVTTKTYKKPYRNHQTLQDRHFDTFPYHGKLDHHCSPGDHAGKSKKKVLEVVQEQHEQLSDSTYRVPCSKFSTHTMPIDLMGCRRAHEKLANSSQSDWLYCSGRNSIDKMLHSYKFHKMRSRRTRMNRLKNGWKKAFVQTVRDGNRNERVGVIVMGPQGPEFYTKNKQQPTNEAESYGNKNSDSVGPKSFEVMTVDCKNVYLSSSEPRTFPTSNLPLPEDETKVDEKLANFSKNVSDIVKTSEEKFYKALSSKGYLEKNKTSDEFHPEGEEIGDEGVKGTQNENNEEENENLKKHPYQRLQYEGLSPRLSKSLRKRERKVNEESKAMADALNKQAKEYKENQLNLNDKETNYMATLKQLQQDFPPKEISEETAKANLSVWGMTTEHLPERKDRCRKEQGDGDDVGSNKLDSPNRKALQKEEKDGLTPSALDQMLSPQSRSKKPLDETLSRKMVDNCAGDGMSLAEMTLEPTTKRPASAGATKWTTCSRNIRKTCEDVKKEADPNLISEMFRDLVENGCAISQEESENLQSLFSKGGNVEACSNDAMSEASSEIVLNPRDESKGLVSAAKTESRAKMNKIKDGNSSKKDEKQCHKPEEEIDNCLEDANAKIMSKLKSHLDEKIFKKFQNKGKSKKKIILDDKMKVLREALPSIAAENEAAHLKQLKKYIERFIERVEANTCSEFQKRKQSRPKVKDVNSTDSSEVRVDARKILDIVNNPFKTISSDVTINIAKKLTDALVQEKASRGSKNVLGKGKKPSEAETDDERFPPCEATSGSGKFSPEKLRLKVEAFLRKINPLTVVTYGILAVAGVIFLVKKCK